MYLVTVCEKQTDFSSQVYTVTGMLRSAVNTALSKSGHNYFGSAVNTALRSTQRKLSVEKSVAIFEVNAMAQVNGIAELTATKFRCNAVSLVRVEQNTSGRM